MPRRSSGPGTSPAHLSAHPSAVSLTPFRLLSPAILGSSRRFQCTGMPQWLTGCKAPRADSIHPGKPPTECLLPQAHTSRSLKARHTHAHHTCRDGTAPADARTVDVDVDVDVDVEPCLGFAPPAPAAALTSADMMTSTDPEPSPEKIQAFRPAVRLLTRPPSTPLNRCRDAPRLHISPTAHTARRHFSRLPSRVRRTARGTGSRLSRPVGRHAVLTFSSHWGTAGPSHHAIVWPLINENTERLTGSAGGGAARLSFSRFISHPSRPHAPLARPLCCCLMHT